MPKYVDPVTAKLLATTDARVWAEEWCRIARGIYDSPAVPPDIDSVIDEGWMIGWFANAIETGRAAGRLAGIAEGREAAVEEAEDAALEASEAFWGEIEVEDDEAGDR